MKVLLIKITIILSACLVSCTLLFIIPINDSENYLMANQDKLQALSATSSPKIVLIGGSNLAFGIDSELISKSLGMPVVNMGLHAGLGISFMINQVKSHLNTGDVVVLVPEYSAYIRPEGSNTLIELLDLDKVAMEHIDLSIIETLTYYFPTYAQSKLVKLLRSRDLNDIRTNGIYFRSAFNESGDVIEHLRNDKGHLAADISKLNGTDYSLSVPETRIIEDFHKWCQIKGIELLISFPAYPETHFKEIEVFAAKIVLSLFKKGLTVISHPEEYKMDDSRFYDTLYHLNQTGRSERTLKLIDDIRIYGDYR